ncbi:hypothetical protein CIG75_17550 [Tumebacillus algifaecis]|uniref:Uncharacterized protein n=1 Tax=Tumebacillus algifaecis TaxID=1214604 RepID=A0A223D4Z8_9BACL|nr:hypothetical protein [Tumebacillus algifaecis]ASS76590.1 hypothetical protein CIG75_17550 [Tumebacillus algifaecis]
MNWKEFYIALAGGLAFGVAWTVSHYWFTGELTYSGIGATITWIIVRMILSTGKRKKDQRR